MAGLILSWAQSLCIPLATFIWILTLNFKLSWTFHHPHPDPTPLPSLIGTVPQVSDGCPSHPVDLSILSLQYHLDLLTNFIFVVTTQVQATLTSRLDSCNSPLIVSLPLAWPLQSPHRHFTKTKIWSCHSPAYNLKVQTPWKSLKMLHCLRTSYTSSLSPSILFSRTHH